MVQKYRKQRHQYAPSIVTNFKTLDILYFLLEIISEIR